ncbi:MAG: hypothetical protein KAS07_01720 [Candidatus Pacebacteria bacterium]|nr:hypothetical protein [Candidatus Paceibacterota bacterium]
MSNVTFDEGFTKRQRSNNDRTTVIGRLFMKFSGGKIKTQKQANVVILVVTILIFVATFYFIFK